MGVITTWQILLFLAVIFLIAEIFVPSFVMLPIGIGLLVSAIVSLWVSKMPDIIYITAALILLVFLTIRSIEHFLFPQTAPETVMEKYVGQRVRVLSYVDYDQVGEVKFQEESWRAVALNDGYVFQPNEYATVKEVRGNKLILAPLEEG